MTQYKNDNIVPSINELQIILTVSMSTGKPLFDASISGSKPLASRKYSLAWFISPLRFACSAASLNSFCRATGNANCFSWRDCGFLRTRQSRKQKVRSVQCLLKGHVVYRMSSKTIKNTVLLCSDDGIPHLEPLILWTASNKQCVQIHFLFLFFLNLFSTWMALNAIKRWYRKFPFVTC